MAVKILLPVPLIVLAGLAGAAGVVQEESFRNPPDSAKPWVYWWWLNGAASREGITRDFAQMKRQGISGALLFDAGLAGPPAPRGPRFMSPQWRAFFVHAVREASRFNITLSVNLSSGWNCGGPWVSPALAAKKIVGASELLCGIPQDRQPESKEGRAKRSFA